MSFCLRCLRAVYTYDAKRIKSLAKVNFRFFIMLALRPDTPGLPTVVHCLGLIWSLLMSLGIQIYDPVISHSEILWLYLGS